MSRCKILYKLSRWNKIIRKKINCLSKCEACILAYISFAITLCRCCGLTTISVFIAKLLEKKEEAIYKRFREFCYDASDKSGEHRKEIDIETCFAPLLAWIISIWKSKQLVLIMDATSLKDRFTVLAISVAYRGFAIPVAWKVLKANQPHPWKEEWLHLLDLIKQSIPNYMQVLVMTDRGLYAKWLFEHIVFCNWIPFMRINKGAYFLPTRKVLFRRLSSFAPRPGTNWAGRGIAFKKKSSQLQCTLLAWWSEVADEPWLILTSIASDNADPGYYSLRAWIEREFRTEKRGGLDWHNTKMIDPIRASRLRLCISLALLLLASAGTESEVDQQIQVSTTEVPIFVEALSKRHISIFRRGWINFIISIIENKLSYFTSLVPEAWPTFINTKTFVAT